MSTIVYAGLNKIRDNAPSGTPPDMKSYAEAMVALIPAEVLSLHALVLSVTTSTGPLPNNGPIVTKITDAATLGDAFWALIVLSVVFYVVSK